MLVQEKYFTDDLPVSTIFWLFRFIGIFWTDEEVYAREQLSYRGV